MNTEAQLTQLLNASCHVSQGTRLHWRRRATLVANIISIVVVLLATIGAMDKVPVPEYSSYKTSQPWGSPEDDCQKLHQMIEHQ